MEPSGPVPALANVWGTVTVAVVCGSAIYFLSQAEPHRTTAAPLQSERPAIGASTTPSHVAPIDAQPALVSPVEAAKAAWKARALGEAAFAQRLLDATPDALGMPMSPTADDGDDEDG